MRNHFLTPVLRQQFTLFYRFGYTFVPDALLIPFEGAIQQSQKDELLKLLSQITPFEYDEEYVILHLQQEGELKPGNTKFEIQQLTTVYPLSKHAKLSISQKIDDRIVLGEPLFESSLAIAEEFIIKQECLKGIEALWEIYLDEATDKDQVLALIGPEKIFHGLDLRSKGKKASELEDEEYWAYLLTYERYDYFPKERIGYFFDAGQLFAYSKEIAFEGSKLHNLLTQLFSLNQKLNFEKIVEKIENDPLAAGYKSKSQFGELKLYVLAPLFLFLKEEIRNAESFTAIKGSPAFSYAKTTFPLEFKAAIILLGAFFKFKTFYDEYYNILNLDIYQAQPQLPAVKAFFKAPEIDTKRLNGNEKEESLINKDLTEGKEIDEATPTASVPQQMEHQVISINTATEIGQTTQQFTEHTISADDVRMQEQTLTPELEILKEDRTVKKALLKERGKSVSPKTKKESRVGKIKTIEQLDLTFAGSARELNQSDVQSGVPIIVTEASESIQQETLLGKEQKVKPASKTDKKKSEKQPSINSAKKGQMSKATDKNDSILGETLELVTVPEPRSNSQNE
ncbi:hypothetical protein [Adhaeribacter rhizoryzae]|uniref:Uncharacterized protein n=1 Tax=Adhaeribacter rhizoryzae TaxID=2607907 RepID=A0A5M6DLD7_9BACT|nr:hypothetical protein [Adhaeribacter rhizoryzae]KAA5548351.1 hypothetical protein F0145_06395 [Adhaeribacter rhizoryzae]